MIELAMLEWAVKGGSGLLRLVLERYEVFLLAARG